MRLKHLAPWAVLATAVAARADLPPAAGTAATETRVEALLARMTEDEKLSLLGGDQEFYIRAIPRLGLPAIRMADGPLGVRNWGLSTQYPAGVALAATWDPVAAHQYGESVARDARSRGVGIMLGPAVNIIRVPENGRNFEYLSEDPVLAGAIASQEVSGMQGQGVVATAKHFAANNQETERGTISAEVGERALREIYLPAFRSAVEEGGAWAVMCAYNKINGTYCSANDWLNNKVLKGDWGFKGVLMSDWGAAHDTLGVANGGLDLEMPSGRYMNAGTLAPLIASGQVAQSTIDDKVRRILRLEVANGFLDREQATSTAKDDPKSAVVALGVARESIVLLKNERSALPLNPKRVKRIVVLGPNAGILPSGGGSAHVSPFHFVSVAEGLRLGAKKATVDLIPGAGPELLDAFVASTTYEGPLKLTFTTGDWRNRKVIATLTDTAIDHAWDRGAPAPGVDPLKYSAHWKGSIRAPSSGRFIFLVRGHGNVSVNLAGKQIIGSWFNSGDTLYARSDLEAGTSYPIEVSVTYDGVGSPSVRFAWGPNPPLLTPGEEARITDADAVIVCAGFNHMLEGEGADRSFELPEGQADLISRAAALNPRTIVVLNSGGSLGLAGWIGKVPAVLEAWYPGQEGGHAVADILLGAYNPSGKLPLSIEAKRSDSASFGHYPGANGKVAYDEGILVGYRWFDAKGIKPLFPFGFGLSYTTFSYSNLKTDTTDDGKVTVAFDVTNNGSRGGDEVAEVYVSPPFPSRVERAVRELKAFSRVSLATDETKRVSIALDRHAFEYFDVAKQAWAVEPGSYTIAVGSSSRNLILTHAVDVP